LSWLAGLDPLGRVGEGCVGVQHRRALPGSVAVERGLDDLAGLRITPLSLAALGDPERPKAGNANLVTLFQRVRYNTDQSLQGFARIGLAQSRLLGYRADQFCLVHGFAHSLRPPTSADCNLIAN
jgi:hypothetical protein